MSQVVTTPHEIEGRWKWDDWGLGPYHALSGVMIGEPYEGHAELTIDVDGDPWHVEVTYSKSGFAPRPEDDIDAPRLYEYDVVGRGPGESKASFNLSPRFPGMRHWETGEKIGLPWEGQFGAVDGIDVEYHLSHIEAERGLELLPEFFGAIFEEAGERIYRGYFREESPHPTYSRMWAYERYVRMRRERAESLARSGVLHTVMLHLADEEGVKATLDIDNEEVINHQNRLVLDPASMATLLPGHSYGRKFEIYQLKDADAVSPDHPSYHPKVEVLVNKAMNDGEAWAWADRQEVTGEIEETLLNFLAWEDIPLAPDASGVYVDDDHFYATAREEDVEIYADPTPRLEAESDHLLMTTLRDMGETPREITEIVATDGGTDVDELAEELGKHPSTIYRGIKQLGELLDLEDGSVTFRARKYREELRALVESAEYAIDSAADRIQHLLGLADHVADCSPFQEWLAENGAELEFGEEGDPKRLRIDTVLSWLRSSSLPYAPDVAREALEKWRKSGNNPAVLRDAKIAWSRGANDVETAFVGAVADR